MGWLFRSHRTRGVIRIGCISRKAADKIRRHMSNHNRKSEKDKDQKNWLEWLVFSISLLLLLAIMGYLVYHVINYKPMGPEIYAEATAEPSVYAPNRYKVIVYNKGGATAEEVKVEFILYKKGKAMEESELQIPFSPKESEREGWVIFRTDPAVADSVIARVVSYKKP